MADMSFDTDGRFQRARYETIKRLIDIFVSFSLIMIAAPVIILCAICIRIDSKGPVFFGQERTGKGGRRFKMWKMRTMVVNADELKEQLREYSQLRYPDFKLENDPRITRVGGFLRKTSLDELPQLFNVLKGDMSLVGPRPTSFESSTYSLWQTARLRVKPGITGLWQISGRSDIEFDDRSRLDIAYIWNRSLWLDLKIIVKTVGVVFNRDGAY